MISRKPKREGYQPLAEGPANAPAYTPPAGTSPSTTAPIPITRASSINNRRVTSPNVERGRTRPAIKPPHNMIAPGQPIQPVRQKDKFVALPDGDQLALPPSQQQTNGTGTGPTIFEDLSDTEAAAAARGRITVYCVSESLDRKAVEGVIKETYPDPVMHTYPDVVHLQTDGDEGITGDVFFFDFGVVVCWGLTQLQEAHVMKVIVRPCQQEPLPPVDVEIDEFEFKYSAHEPPHMQNDTITVNKRQAADHQVKLAICNALAQSTKLSVYEERVMATVLETKDLPEALAKYGTVHVTSKAVAQLIGKVFLQRSAVNLLSTVLDTPEFFWSAPDQLQALYERACEYLELETRVEVLNSRFQVLGEMLNMLRDHQNNHHNSRLEWIIIWLIAIELLVGLCQLAGLFGLVGRQ